MKRHIIEKYLRPEEEVRENVYYHCPNCNWKNPRLGIDYDNGKFFCWYCHWGSSSLTSILYKVNASKSDIEEMKKLLGEEKQYAYKPKNTLYDLRNALEEKFATNGNTVEYSKFVKLPDGYKPIIDNRKNVPYRPAINYLVEKRGLTMFEIGYYGIMYNPKLEMLLFPSYAKDGNMNFYVKRTASSTYKFYENAKEVKSSTISFFESLTDFSRPVVLTEGVFDAMKFGFNAVPILGTYMNKRLIHNVVEYKTPRVIINLDSDAFSSTVQHATLLKKYVKNIYLVPPHNHKDVGEMDKKEIKELTRPENLITFDDDFILQYKLQNNLI